MKRDILCPRCEEAGHKPQVLGKFEDLRGKGDLLLWCKKCRREICICIEELVLIDESLV